jgi:hypothetical protein
MRDELLMILDMLAAHKLSRDEARRLVEALGRRKDGTALAMESDRVNALLAEVEDGRLKPADGVERLQAADLSEATHPVESPPAKWLRITVQQGGRQQVNVRLPMGLVHAGLRVAQSLPLGTMQINGTTMDIRELVNELRQLGPGQMMEIDDGDDHVEVWLE